MNMNQRELRQHVEYEPDTYYSAFSAELEICASPMWLLLVHCKDQVPIHTSYNDIVYMHYLMAAVLGFQNSQGYTTSVMKHVISSLQDWFDAINTRPFSRVNLLYIFSLCPVPLEPHSQFSTYYLVDITSIGPVLQDLITGPVL